MTEQHHEVVDLRWKQVTCTRCDRTFMCTPWDGFHDPREEFGWHKGGVCDKCLEDLYRRWVTRTGAMLPLRDPSETHYRERMVRSQIRRGRRR